MKINNELKNVMGIYRLQINEHTYIGSSVNLYKRLGIHIRTLKKNKHENQYLQNCINKYGLNKLKYDIVATFTDISYDDLLKHELYFINYYKADLNLKPDPTTQYNCITTSKPIYQFSLFGEMIKLWPSTSEVSRKLGFDVGCLSKACVNRDRQRIVGGFLWSYNSVYEDEIEILYVFDLKGKYLNKFTSTKDIYTTYFLDLQQKTVLSQLRKKINTNIPYKFIYISTSKTFTINSDYNPRYKEKSELELTLNNNPDIYIYSKTGELTEIKQLSTFNDINYIKRKIRSNSPTYSLGEWNGFLNYNSIKVEVENIQTGEKTQFNSLKEASTACFGKEISDYKNSMKHMKRGTPYKNFRFNRVL